MRDVTPNDAATDAPILGRNPGLGYLEVTVLGIYTKRKIYGIYTMKKEKKSLRYRRKGTKKNRWNIDGKERKKIVEM